MTPELESAIEDVYRAFAGYYGGAAAGCPCCVSEEEQARLKSKKLRELDDADLGSYAFSALSTWGTLNDFKHFLPRILELEARGAIWTDLQVVYGKLKQEGPWSAEELGAIQRFTNAMFIDALDTPGCDVLDVVESAGYAGLDVMQMLDGALSEPATSARATALATFTLSIAPQLSSGRWGWIWWQSGDTECVKRWMLDGRVRGYLARAFEAHVEDPRAGKWAEASDVLEALEGSA